MSSTDLEDMWLDLSTVRERYASVLTSAANAAGALRPGERLVEPARPDKLRSSGRGEQ